MNGVFMNNFKLLLLFIIVFINMNIFSNEIAIKNINVDKINKNCFAFSKNYSASKTNDQLKLYNKFIIIGSVFTGSAGILLTTGLIMGFVPIDGTGGTHLPHSAFERNIFMTAYGSVGVSLIIIASVFLLFSLPFLIYGIVKKNIYLKNNNDSKQEVSFNFYSGMISIKFD